MEEGHRTRRTDLGRAARPRARLRIGRRRQQIMATDNRRDAPADGRTRSNMRECGSACLPVAVAVSLHEEGASGRTSGPSTSRRSGGNRQ